MQNIHHSLLEAKSSFILLQIPTNFSSDVLQSLLLPELPNEFDVKETLCINISVNISEKYLEISPNLGERLWSEEVR